jgi:predicted small lipoprotein YifL
VKTISPLVALSLAATLAGCTTAGPVPPGDVVATVYKDGSALYVEPLPPQSNACKPLGQPGCRASRVYYGYANVTPQQQAQAERFYGSANLERNRVLVVGHLATVEVRDHRTNVTSQQTWFMVNKLYLTPFRGRVIERHSTQFFYATGTTSNAQVVAISRGEQSPRAARITWTGMATYGGSSGPSSVEDMFVTGQADFTRSPLPIRVDEYFVRQTRLFGAGRLPPFDRVRSPY